jgi:DNA-binding MarR family transcriptional regulator
VKRAQPATATPTANDLLKLRNKGEACVYGNIRMAARAITGLYDAAFEAIGLSANQANALWMVYAMQPVSKKSLSSALHSDESTLTRNLRPLLARGLLQERVLPADRRSKALTVTPHGRKQFLRMLPLWDAAQENMRERLGPELIQELRHIAKQVVAQRREMLSDTGTKKRTPRRARAN